MAEEEKDDWLEDLDEEGENASELDQSDIDSLLTGTDDEGEGGAEEELDQSDIDSLLSGDDENSADAAPVEAEAAADTEDSKDEGADELDQSDLDALLAETDSPDDDESGSDPDQEEIDQLFSEVENDELPEEDPFQAEEVDFKDVIEDKEEGDESFTLDGSSFDAEEFGIDEDIPDIPDIPSDDGDTTMFEEETDSPVQADSTDDEVTRLMDQESDGDSEGKKFNIPAFAIPPALQNRKVQVIAGGCLTVLVALGLFLSGGDKEPQPEVAKQQEQVQKQTPPEQAAVPPEQVTKNSVPQASNNEFIVASGKQQTAITLIANDTDGDKLEYEILSQPQNGILSGTAPNLTYTTNKGFTGKDSFMFRVSDGKDISTPATVTVSQEEPVVKVAGKDTQHNSTTRKKRRTVKAKKLVIAAQGKTYKLASTENVIIDWEDLWSKANYLPYTSKIKVEIISKTTHGNLKKIDSRQSLYKPDKYFGGKETISYRFRLAKLKSKVRQLKLRIKMGKPAPEIHLHKMAKMYGPGDTVVLDASPSRDENRESLSFSWQQVSGVPVQIESLNEEKSQVAFVVPSSFNTIADPGPVLRLTAVDRDGQKDEKDIKVATRSRRPTAIWRGLVTGGIAEEPYCPYENCPGALLPWPYGD